MGRTCDVCGKQLGVFKKFRYAQGYICKECYAKASRQFTQTIRDFTFEEVKELCSVERDVESFEQFEVTGKIGNYILVDEKHGKICIPHNRLTNKKVEDPKFLEISDIKTCHIAYDPHIPMEELLQKVKEQKSEEKISFLKVELLMKNHETQVIPLLHQPVRIKSYAFRQSFQFARRIQDELVRLMKQ